VKKMIVTLVIIIVISLAFLGFMALLYPDSAYWVASSVMTPEQINSTTVAVPYVAEPINVIPILPFVIIGFILIIMLVVVSRK
jgi:hypothetical protein